MLQRTRDAIARIDVRQGARVVSRGTGFLVTPRLVLTALHVVGDRNQDPPLLYDQAYELRLVFPRHSTRGRVVSGRWHRLADWALVECDEPPAVQPLPLAELNDSGQARAWETHGFPDANPQDGMVHAGYVANHGGDMQGVPVAQLFSDQAAAGDGSPVRGLSGAPVMVDDAVVGLLRYSLMKEGLNVAGTLYACPVGVVVDACGDLLPLPDPAWGLPGLPRRDLPARPFRYLSWFTEDDAEIFFGRKREIRAVYERLVSPEASSLLLLYGQSGVGKSSFLAAGLLPRLRFGHEIVYVRRERERSLEDSLCAALRPLAGDAAEDGTVAALWRGVESLQGRPLIAILDQVEEIYTRPSPERANDLARFLAAMRGVFADSATRPRGRLLLSFRKEWYAEILKQVEEVGLPHSRVFLEALGSDGVLEAVTGLTSTRRLRERYGLAVEDDLGERIAGDLSDDRDSPLAPTLQILLTKMWEQAQARQPSRPRFDLDLYRSLKRAYALDDFLKAQLATLEEHEPDAARSGLALDLLAYHTTAALTADQRSEEQLRERYNHVGESAGRVTQELKSLYLLVHAAAEHAGADGATRLAHDTLAPHVRRMSDKSDRPGQRARRILENRALEWSEGRSGTPLDEHDLSQVEAGRDGTRAPSDDEQRLIAASLGKRSERALREIEGRVKHERRERALRWAKRGAFTAVIVGLAVAGWFWYAASAARRDAEIDREAYRAVSELAVEPLTGVLRAVSATGEALKHAQRPPAAVQMALSRSVDEAIESDRLDDGGRVKSDPLRRRPGVMSVAYAPAGDAIAAGYMDGWMRVWRWSGGDAVEPFDFEAHAGTVRAVAFAAGDPATLVTAGHSEGTDGQNSLKLWKRSASESGWVLDRAVSAHPGGGTAGLAVSRDGRALVTTGVDDTVRLWSREGLPLGELRGQTSQVRVNPPMSLASPWRSLVAGQVSAVAVSPDGEWVVTGAIDGKVRLWRLAGDRDNPVVAAGHEARVDAITFIDERHVASGSEDKTIRFWDLDGRTASQTLGGHDAGVRALGVSIDGRRLLAGDGGGTVWRYDLLRDASGRLSARWAGSAFRGPDASVTSVRISPNGQRAAVGGLDGLVRILDFSSTWLGTFVRTPERLWALALSPDGRRVAHGGRLERLRFTHLTASGVTSVETDEERPLRTLARLSDERVVSATMDGVLRFWNWEGQTLGEPVRLERGPLGALAVSERGGWIASGHRGGAVQLWGTDGQPRGAPIRAHTADVTGLAADPAGRLLVSGAADGEVRLWTTKGGPHGDAMRCAGGVEALAFDHAGSRLASGCDQRWRLWSTGGSLLAEKKAHNGPVVALAFSPDDHTIASAGVDDTVRLWDDEGRSLGEPFTLREDGGFTALEFNADGQTLVTTGYGSLFAPDASPDPAKAKSPLDGNVAVWRAGWLEWLKTLCRRVRHHSVIDNPESDPANAELARSAAAVCQERVWGPKLKTSADLLDPDPEEQP